MSKRAAVLATLLCCTSAMAATGDSGGQHYVPSVGLLVALLAAFTARRSFGGWLLCYYWLLFAGSGIAFAAAWMSAPGMLTTTSSHGAVAVLMNALGLIPWLAAMLAQLGLSIALIFLRNETTLRLVRLSQVWLIGAIGLSALIGAAYFHNAEQPLGALGLMVVAGIWSLYFRKSKRVQLVFVDHTWAAVQAQANPPSVRSYRWRRAAISASVVFVVLWALMMASPHPRYSETNYEGPLVFAFLVGLLGLFLPVSRAKLEALKAAAPIT